MGIRTQACDIMHCFSKVCEIARYGKTQGVLRGGRFVRYVQKKERSLSETPFLLLEQMTGIEPAYSAWEADTLPLSYTCLVFLNYNTKPLYCQVKIWIFLKSFLFYFRVFSQPIAFYSKLCYNSCILIFNLEEK